MADKSSNFGYGNGIAKQILNIIFLVDDSGSMSGPNINAVNAAITELLQIIPEIEKGTIDAEIRVAALSFSDKVHWIQKEPVSARHFKWEDLFGDGSTNLTEAYRELGKQLIKKSHGGMMPDFGGVAPILLLMSDGMPTSLDWAIELGILYQKIWFSSALRYALAIGACSDEAMQVLLAFTGSADRIIKVFTAEALKNVIQVIAVTASKVKSKSASISSVRQTNNEIAETEIKAEIEKIEGVESGW